MEVVIKRGERCFIIHFVGVAVACAGDGAVDEIGDGASYNIAMRITRSIRAIALHHRACNASKINVISATPVTP